MGFLRNLFGKRRSAVTPSNQQSKQEPLQEIGDAYVRMLQQQGQAVEEATVATYMLKIRDGLQAEAQKDYQQAVKSYTEAVNLLPQLPDAYYWRGDLYRPTLEQSQLALHDINKVIELIEKHNCRALVTELIQHRTPSSVLSHAYMARGGAYNDLGDFEKAENDLKKFEELE